jgi:hypothetical protein
MKSGGLNAVYYIAMFSACACKEREERRKPTGKETSEGRKKNKEARK